MKIGKIDLGIEFDKFGIMHTVGENEDKEAGFKKGLNKLVLGTVKLSDIETAFDDRKFRYGVGKLYLQYRYMTEILPLVNRQLAEDGRERISENEVIAALSFGLIGDLFMGRLGTDVCYGLLKGKLEYIDIIRYPVRYRNGPLSIEEKMSTPELSNEIIAYYEKYGNDLSHVDELSEEAVYILDNVMASVFCYDIVFRGMSMDSIRDAYKCPISVQRYFSSLYTIVDALGKRLDMGHIFRILDCFLNLYPRGSKEHKRITEAFLMVGAMSDCNTLNGKTEAYKIGKDNPVALIIAEVGGFGHGTLGEWIPAELRVATWAWIEKDLYTRFYKDRVASQSEFIDERIDRHCEVLKIRDKDKDIQKQFFYIDMYLKKPVVFEFYRQKNDLLWKYADDKEAFKEAHREAWNDDPRSFITQLAEGNVSEEAAAEELMQLYSGTPENNTYHLLKGERAVKRAAEKTDYYHNTILDKLDVLHRFEKVIAFNTDEHSSDKLDAFVTGKLQMKADTELGLKVGLPSNNLILVYEEESDYSPEIVKGLNKLLGCKDDVSFINAYELGPYLKRRFGDEESYDYGESDDMDNLLCVLDFKPHPTINIETGTGSAQEREKDEYRRFKEGWDRLIRVSRDFPRRAFVIVTSRRNYVESYTANTELIYRTFKYRVFIEPMRENQILERTLGMLEEEEEFSFSADFEKALKKYIDAIYREADLKGTQFVKDLKNRILTLYYEKLRSDHIITTDCIPKYSEDLQTPDAIISSLDDLVGLDKVKKTIRNIYTNLLVERKVDRNNSKKKQSVKKPLHMKFTGNPGTGKTTVARRITKLYYSMGLIKKNKFVESKPSDLMSYWSSGTNVKAKKVIEDAYGGVLFIDEAYGFINNGDRGQQALQEVLVAMENHPDDLIVIMAGYKEEMRSLMKSNSGLSSRFAYELEFEDYSMEELTEIFSTLCKEEELVLAENAVQSLENCLLSKRSGEFFGNAREVRNIFNQVKEARAKRIYDENGLMTDNIRADAMMITEADFAEIMPKKREIGISDMIGLSELKKKLEEFKKQVVYQRYLREHGVNLPSFSMHMLFTGNPGTGKTTVAKMIAEDLYAIGILKTNQLVVAEKKDLVSGIVAETASKTADMVKRARGGVLFVDEAYSLTDGGKPGSTGLHGHGHEAIEALLTAMEEYKEDTVFIFAGYTNEMQEFLEINPGIMSRIGYTFSFEDYTPEELMEIYDKKMNGYGLITKDAARKKIYDIMSFFSEVPNFGNGRFVDHVIHQIIMKRAERFDINSATGYKEILVRDIPGHKELIETAPNRDQLYDPSELTREAKRRTAVHECGHAIVGYVLNRKHVPEMISVRSGAASFGRVKLGKRTAGNMTENDLRNMIAELLAGRNAERVFYKENATGVSEDYNRAKRIARSMIRDFAMGEIGDGNALAILKEEDKRSTEIIEKHKDFISAFADRLLEEKEISGEEMVKAFKEFYK